MLPKLPGLLHELVIKCDLICISVTRLDKHSVLNLISHTVTTVHGFIEHSL